MDYLRKFPDVGIQTIETRNTSPLTLSGHVTVQITSHYFLVTALIRTIHHFEWTYNLVDLFATKTTKAQVTIALLKRQRNYARKKYYCRCRTMILNAIGDFRVAFRLCFEASPSAKPFMWKLVLFADVNFGSFACE